MKLSEYRQKILVFTALNFFIGSIIGIILFYGQLNADKKLIKSSADVFISNPGIIQFIHLAWSDMLWLFAIFIAYGIFPAAAVNPIMLVRGSICTFSASYIMYNCGIKTALTVIIPQCLSLFPAMAYFSASVIIKRKLAIKNGREPDTFKRSDFASICLISIICASIEMLIFKFLCMTLF